MGRPIERSAPEPETVEPEDDGSASRRSDRQSVHKHAILHAHDRTQSVLIRDISAGGMKIQNAFGLMPGDEVRVELLTRRGFAGKIAWSLPPFCGIKFDTVLDSDDPLLRMK